MSYYSHLGTWPPTQWWTVPHCLFSSTFHRTRYIIYYRPFSLLTIMVYWINSDNFYPESELSLHQILTLPVSYFLLLSSFFHLVTVFFGEGNGTPPQYSCLENPMDGGTWWATVLGSWRVGHDWATSLSLFTFMHWEWKWQPTPVFLPGESQGRGSLVVCHLGGRTESDTTEAT